MSSAWPGAGHSAPSRAGQIRNHWTTWEFAIPMFAQAPEAPQPRAADELEKIWKKDKKPRYNKDGTLRKPRSGWGPYRSVVRERAVAFNLQLDVQNLKQEVQNLSALREILQAKTLQSPHTPEGSLVRLVKEYFHVFRAGPALLEQRTPFLDRDQRAFLATLVDEQAEVGAFHGPEAVMHQFEMYLTLLRFIRMTMHSYDIVVAEDFVVIAANVTLRLQVLRRTIEDIFPHIVGDEWLVAQLVGQEVEPKIKMSFFFKEGKCCKIDVDVDFIGAFAHLVKDPAAVALLFGRALIGDNSMLGTTDSATATAEVSTARKRDEDRNSFTERLSDNESKPSGRSTDWDNSLPSNLDIAESARALCLQSVEYYFAAFAIGYLEEESASSPPEFAVQRAFIRWANIMDASHDSTGTSRTVERWRSLSKCFAVLKFHQQAIESVELDSLSKACTIQSTARYILRITPNTIRFVFTHLASHPHLREELQGKVLAVPSQIAFAVDGDTGQIRCITERMDFEAALAKLLATRQELGIVLSGANLASDGVAVMVNDERPRSLIPQTAAQLACADGTPRHTNMTVTRLLQPCVPGLVVQC